jgi:hypothetical protein
MDDIYQRGNENHESCAAGATGVRVRRTRHQSKIYSHRDDTGTLLLETRQEKNTKEEYADTTDLRKLPLEKIPHRAMMPEEDSSKLQRC